MHSALQPARGHRRFNSPIDVRDHAAVGSEAYAIACDKAWVCQRHRKQRLFARRQHAEVDGNVPAGDRRAVSIQKHDEGREVLDLFARRRIADETSDCQGLALRSCRRVTNSRGATSGAGICTAGCEAAWR